MKPASTGCLLGRFATRLSIKLAKRPLSGLHGIRCPPLRYVVTRRVPGVQPLIPQRPLEQLNVLKVLKVFWRWWSGLWEFLKMTRLVCTSGSSGLTWVPHWAWSPGYPNPLHPRLIHRGHDWCEGRSRGMFFGTWMYRSWGKSRLRVGQAEVHHGQSHNQREQGYD